MSSNFQSAFDAMMGALQSVYPERKLVIEDIVIVHFDTNGQKIGVTFGTEGVDKMFDEMTEYAKTGGYSEMRVKDDTDVDQNIKVIELAKPNEVLLCLDRNDRELKVGDIVGFNDMEKAEGLIKEIGENTLLVFWKDIGKENRITFAYAKLHLYFISEGSREELADTDPLAVSKSVTVRNMFSNTSKYTEEDFQNSLKEMEDYMLNQSKRDYNGGKTFNSYTLAGDCDCPSCNISRMIADKINDDEKVARRWAGEASDTMKYVSRTGQRRSTATPSASPNSSDIADIMKRISEKITELSGPAPTSNFKAEEVKPPEEAPAIVEEDNAIYLAITENFDQVAKGYRPEIDDMIEDFLTKYPDDVVNIYKFVETVEVDKRPILIRRKK